MGVRASPRLWERVEAAWSNISHMRGKKPQYADRPGFQARIERKPYVLQTSPSVSLLVIRGKRSNIATSGARVVTSKRLVNQRRSEPSSRGPLGHSLAFTKSDDDPGGRGHVWYGELFPSRRRVGVFLRAPHCGAFFFTPRESRKGYAAGATRLSEQRRHCASEKGLRQKQEEKDGCTGRLTRHAERLCPRLDRRADAMRRRLQPPVRLGCDTSPGRNGPRAFQHH